MARSFVLILCIIFLAIFNISAEKFVSNQLKVKLKHGGVLIGRHMTSHHGRNVRGFLGIPYAKPPVGKLRFSAPEPADAWEGVRLAINDGNSCPQVDVFFQDTVFLGDEDCLYLNVYVPEEPKSKEPLPVMFWIHGGGFVMGTGMKAFYDPKLLMDRDIVLVSINYRLSILGFLSSETVDLPGNFGLKDQVLALQWVQDNIAAFGGDPKSVTIFGESAGGASVTLLSISEKTKGLFHKAIAQSGTHYNTWAQPAPKGYAASLAEKLVDRAGCNNPKASSSDILDCLRKIDFKTITELGNLFWEWFHLPMPMFPIVIEPEHEDAFLTHNLQATNYSNSVPLMIGYTSEEGLLFMNLLADDNFDKFKADYDDNTPVILDYRLSAKEYHPMIKTSVNQYYFPNGKDNNENITNLLTDSWFFSGIDKHVRDRLATKEKAAPTYLYTFENKGLSFLYTQHDSFHGTVHGDDMLYLFPINEFLTPTVAPTKRDAQLREHMLDLWTNFATYGDPTPQESKLPKWAAVDNYPPKMLQIGNKNEDGPLLHLRDTYPTARAEFWQSMEPYLVKQPLSKN